MKKVANILKTLVVCLVLLVPSALFSSPLIFNEIVFFGDSLSDNGNLFAYDFGYLPKSPPYFQGRFTNGYAWTDKVAKYFYDQDFIASKNYALGGQTAIFHGPSDTYLPVTMGMSISSYLVRTSMSDRSKTLFIIWIGANDYLHHAKSHDIPQGHVHDHTTQVIDGIKSNIERLIYYGAKNFIVINLPDLGRTPLGTEDGFTNELHELTIKHNQKLARMVDALQESYKTLRTYTLDANGLLQELIQKAQDPNDNTLPIKNTTDSCWKGGYTLRKEENISEDLNQYILKHQKKFNGQHGKTFDPQTFKKTIVNSPELLEAFRLMQAEEEGQAKPCTNGDEYIFWDRLHPSAMVHKLFAEKIIGVITENFHE